jgi:hypothetical protein
MALEIKVTSLPAELTGTTGSFKPAFELVVKDGEKEVIRETFTTSASAAANKDDIKRTIVNQMQAKINIYKLVGDKGLENDILASLVG